MNPFFKADDKICPLCKKEPSLAYEVLIITANGIEVEYYICERCYSIIAGAKFYPGPLTFDPAVEIPAIKATVTIFARPTNPTPVIKMEHTP